MKKLLAIRNTKKKNNKGFTLVELIVVIAIIAILAAIAIPAYNNVQSGATESKNKANANLIIKTGNMYNSLKVGSSAITDETQLNGNLNLAPPDLVTMNLTLGMDTNDFNAAVALIDYDTASKSFKLK